MKTEQKALTELDALIEEVLCRDEEAAIPDGFTDRMLKAMEKRIFLQEMIMEFGYKCLIAMGALLVFILIFFFVSVKELTLLRSYLIHNWSFMAAILGVGFFILFADQVFLKYLFKKRQTQ